MVNGFSVLIIIILVYCGLFVFDIQQLYLVTNCYLFVESAVCQSALSSSI